jgi:hypothetical protein
MDNWDIALLKETHFTESKALEFRLDGNINDTTFGQVISADSPRLIQAALKFRF